MSGFDETQPDLLDTETIVSFCGEYRETIVDMSTGIGAKIREIREAEGLTRKQFAELTGILETVQKSYELGKRENIGIDTVMKITNHPQFKKYTTWLLNGETNEAAGQISPLLSPNGLENTSSTPNTKKVG